MRNSRTAALILAALTLAACTQKATIKGTVDGAAGKQLVVRQLNVNTYNTLDTIKTNASGAFKYSLEVKEGQPEFVYLFYGNTRIAAFLLESGETAQVSADTLGNYTILGGSEGSEKLAVVDKAYSDFANELLSETDDQQAMSRTYIRHYRESMKYVLENSKSLTVVPVLFETLGGGNPVFSQATDALIFRSTADSLKKVYPDSRYVKALEKEAESRMKTMELANRINAAGAAGYPDVSLPDTKGQMKSISSIDAKAILVHFWDASDAAQKMYNIDGLLPLYNEFHKRGFEIYQICVSTDKAEWGSVVTSQKLPWVNVCDGLGAYSPAAVAFNVTSIPHSYLIVDGELSTKQIDGEASFRKELDSILRR